MTQYYKQFWISIATMPKFSQSYHLKMSFDFLSQSNFLIFYATLKSFQVRLLASFFSPSARQSHAGGPRDFDLELVPSYRGHKPRHVWCGQDLPQQVHRGLEGAQRRRELWEFRRRGVRHRRKSLFGIWALSFIFISLDQFYLTKVWSRLSQSLIITWCLTVILSDIRLVSLWLVMMVDHSPGLLRLAINGWSRSGNQTFSPLHASSLVLVIPFLRYHFVALRCALE